MAVNEYLQAAAAQLENAANALKLEMDSMRGEYMAYDREVGREITKKETEIHALNAKLMTSQPDATEAAVHLRIQSLQRDIETMKREHSEKNKKLDQDVRGKQNTINDLMSKASGLRNQASSLR